MSSPFLARLGAFLALLLSAAACETTYRADPTLFPEETLPDGGIALSCGAQSCAGCCDGAGVCQTGALTETCGAGGSTCVACAAGARCTSGTCVATARPNVMVLLDRSGSMSMPIDFNDPHCPSGCGELSPCPDDCLTRWGVIRTGLKSFLARSGTRANFGLLPFGIDKTCGAAKTSDIATLGTDLWQGGEDEAARQAHAGRMLSRVEALTPTGGTPTSASLRALRGYAPLQDARQRNAVLLITDGLPNCNEANRDSCDTGTCNCLLSPATACIGSYCALGCLDQETSVDEVLALRAKGIRTYVIGVGSSVTGTTATEVFEAMARAGGMPPRRCDDATAEVCGTGTCSGTTRTCSTLHHSAQSQAQLDLALGRAFEQILEGR